MHAIDRFFRPPQQSFFLFGPGGTGKSGRKGDAALFGLAEAMERHPTRLLAYCVMPNHWHMVIWPREDGELTEFLRWLTHTHVMRWHAHHGTSGTGHLYQGRFKAFPVQGDEHFYTVVRYVERNPLRAGLVSRAEQWRWSSLWRRLQREAQWTAMLHRWPLPMPAGWVKIVNEPMSEAELEAVRRAAQRGRPYGSPRWQVRTARRLGLEYTLRRRGRPRKGQRK